MADLPSLRAAPNPPTSRENAELVRALYASFSGLSRGGEIASYVATYFDSDCEYRPVEEASTVRGHAALGRWVRRWLEAWEDAWDEVDEIFDAGERVVAAIKVHGRGRISGMEISQRLFDVVDLRAGRVVRVREYLEPDQAFEAAGLR
jgi:ketosteroid isomerase-like protein